MRRRPIRFKEDGNLHKTCSNQASPLNRISESNLTRFGSSNSVFNVLICSRIRNNIADTLTFKNHLAPALHSPFLEFANKSIPILSALNWAKNTE